MPNEYSELLWSLLGLALLAWFFFDSLRARERAVARSRQACDHANVQFLDETVALVRLGVRRSEQGLVWRRVYHFEYADGAHPCTQRGSGLVILRGAILEDVYLRPAAPGCVCDFPRVKRVLEGNSHVDHKTEPR